VGKKGEDLRADLEIGKLFRGKKDSRWIWSSADLRASLHHSGQHIWIWEEIGTNFCQERLRNYLLDANCERDKMPHITTAMERSMRRSVVDYALGGLLGRRDIVGEVNSVKNTFSSWDNCMAQSYCKSVSRSAPQVHANQFPDGPSSC
jgi:hypothetical protein